MALHHVPHRHTLAAGVTGRASGPTRLPNGAIRTAQEARFAGWRSWIATPATGFALAGLLAVSLFGASLGIALSGNRGQTAATAGAASTSGAGAPAAGAVPGMNPNDAVMSASAKPAADWKPFDPVLAPASGDTVHRVTFHIQDRVLEVAPGVRQTVWTFNGQAPGPVLRGHVGDTFSVTLVNDDPVMPHSIDFHASQTSMDTNMRELLPGKSLVYQFKAQYSGIFMYHCGSAPALQHIGNGMYGAVIIDPPGLPPVDHEYVMIQSEQYYGPQGEIGDYAKMQAAAPDAVVFNGYYAQYKFDPISVAPGNHIRVWVLNVGPSDISSFHIVGTIFNAVYKEGAYTLAPGGSGGSQALDLMPAQGGFVETTFSDPGHYAMVTHRFADVNKGAVGTITVATPTPGAVGN